MKNVKKAIAAVVIILLAVFIAFRLFGKEEETVQYETRPTVSVETPVKGDITLYTDMIGSVEPQSKAMVLPKTRGEALEIYFQAGDYVEAGQPLVKIDSDILTSLKISLDSAQITLNDANNALARTRALFDSGVVSQQTLEQAQSGAKNAQLAYDASKNQYDLQVGYTTVTAPISGIVESRNVNENDHLEMSSLVCIISAVDQYQVNFGITEKTLQNLSVGSSIKVEKNGIEYDGQVTEIGSMVNTATGLYDAKAAVPEAKGLTTGTRVKLTVVMEQAADVMTIPVDAVNYNNGVAFVYCNNNGVAEKIEIEAGIYDSERMEIKSGLTEDSQVITSWSNELVNGAEVLIAPEDTN
jgi:RND family efflux transporter MFP subunit